MDFGRLGVKAREYLFNLISPEVDFYLDGDKLKVNINGSFSFIYKPLADFFCKRLNEYKVIGKVNGANVYTMYSPPLPSEAGKRSVMARIKDKYFNLKCPTTATISITYRCQADCVHCSRFDKIDPTQKELSTEELKKVIDDAIDLGVVNITLTGGDPLIRDDVYEIIDHVDKSKAIVLMFTNGLMLNEKTVKKLKKAGLYGLNISIDDVDPKIHDSLRKVPGCYEKAINGALMAKEEGILIGISTYVTKQKIADGSLEALLYKAKELGFNEVTIFDPIPSGKFRLKMEDILLTYEERTRVAEIVKKFIEMDGNMGIIAQSYVNSPFSNGCFGGFYQFYLTAYGDVNPCDFNPVSFGNIRKMPLRQIWNRMTSHPEYKYRKFRCRMQDPVYRKRFIDHVPEHVRFPIPIEVCEGKPVEDAGSCSQCLPTVPHGRSGYPTDEVLFERFVKNRPGATQSS